MAEVAKTVEVDRHLVTAKPQPVVPLALGVAVWAVENVEEQFGQRANSAELAPVGGAAGLIQGRIERRLN